MSAICWSVYTTGGSTGADGADGANEADVADGMGFEEEGWAKVADAPGLGGDENEFPIWTFKSA